MADSRSTRPPGCGNAVGAVRVVLSTAHTNTAAQALYESTGWALDRDYRVYEYPLR